MDKFTLLDQLIEKMRGDDLTESEQKRLVTLLEESTEAQERFARQMAMSAILRDHYALVDRGGVHVSGAATTPRVRLASAPTGTSITLRGVWLTGWLPWGIAAACLVTLVSYTMGIGRRESGTPMSPVIASTADTIPDPAVALLVDASGAEFAAGRGPCKARFEAGSYEMRKGVAHLRFSNGVDVVLNAPVEFTIDDPLHLRLDYGNLRAIVPPAAQGFTVLTPGVDYEDFGTEFGVTVSRATGSSKLHVFDGQVDAKITGTHDSLTSVMGGDSVQFAHGKLQKIAAASSDDFPTPSVIGLLRWKQKQHEFTKDPTLVGYFPFVPVAKPLLLANAAPNSSMQAGEINGARWVSGRWPGKHALLFDLDTDFVQLYIPGEFQEMTMAVWVKVIRLDYEMNAILNSDDWEFGDVHWQFTRQGFPRGGPKLIPKRPHNPKEFVGEPITLGAWSHVVIVMSLPNRLQKIYVNGRLVMVKKLLKAGVIRPGSCRLGNWLIRQEGEDIPSRALRGRIDELAIWSRALPLNEIQQLVKNGHAN